MRTALRIIVPMAAATVVLAGCGVADNLIEDAVGEAVEQGVENATGADIEVDDDGEGVSITTEDGEFSVGGDGTLPEGFPERDVPLVDGEIVQSARVTNEQGEGFMVGLSVEGDIADVYDDSASRLEGAGYTQTASTEAGQLRTAAYEGTGDVAAIVVSAIADGESGPVTVNYVVTMKGAE